MAEWNIFLHPLCAALPTGMATTLASVGLNASYPKVNQKKRVQWAKDNEATDWRTIQFKDEACFKVGKQGSREY